MQLKDFNVKIFGTGFVLGLLLLVGFFFLARAEGLRTGFYGVPPNATWYHPKPAPEAAPPAEAHGHTGH